MRPAAHWSHPDIVLCWCSAINRQLLILFIAVVYEGVLLELVDCGNLYGHFRKRCMLYEEGHSIR